MRDSSRPMDAMRFLVIAGVVGSAACNDGGPRATNPVGIRVAASQPAVGGGGSSLLVLTGLRLAVGQASLGSADQFGCQDCNQQGPESGSGGASIVAVPVDGGDVLLSTELVGPGRFDSAEVDLTAPSVAPAGWAAGATIEVTGTYNGVAFTLALPISGAFRTALTPPAVITAGSGGQPQNVTIRLPVASWFDNGGTALDPTNAAQRALIESNARRAFLTTQASGVEH